MAECLELSCASAKITLFPLELCSRRTLLPEQKLEHTKNCSSKKPLKGMLNKHKAHTAIQTQAYSCLSPPLQTIFIWGHSFHDVEGSCSKPVTFQLILS